MASRMSELRHSTPEAVDDGIVSDGSGALLINTPEYLVITSGTTMDPPVALLVTNASSVKFLAVDGEVG